ncbi:hypothetical protein HDV62DRAFT_343041 [Trichoderma sp. SZMC 28011]
MEKPPSRPACRILRRLLSWHTALWGCCVSTKGQKAGAGIPITSKQDKYQKYNNELKINLVVHDSIPRIIQLSRYYYSIPLKSGWRWLVQQKYVLVVAPSKTWLSILALFALVPPQGQILARYLCDTYPRYITVPDRDLPSSWVPVTVASPLN